ncbi:hypothetical protein [Listeria booriae]|uniref:Uncharacterized protein n=1 Tax=Listeria booriae TaxID=1552123 RepID=A0A841ZTQ7_9LIST|nr:hypothetical protein [Listeria booriae]MBC1564119.1 hypothetical protein [Listeria booriae]
MIWKVKYRVRIREGVTDVENFKGSVAQYKELATDEYTTLTALIKADSHEEAYENFNKTFKGVVTSAVSIKPVRKWWGGKKA